MSPHSSRSSLTTTDQLCLPTAGPIQNPTVVSQIQSHTGGDWVKTRHQAVTSAGFQMKQEEDGLDIGHNTEVYGWIALPKGTGSIGGLDYEAIVTPNTVTRKMHIILSRFARTRVADLESITVADQPYDVTYTSPFDDQPGFFSSLHTFNGADPSHMRMDASSRTGATIFIEEDTCSDAELAHTDETISIVAMELGIAQ